MLLSAILACGYATVAWSLRGSLAVTFDLRRRKDLLDLAAGAGVTGLVFVAALCLVAALLIVVFAMGHD